MENVLDKFIGFFNPGAALKRIASRQALEQVRGFDAASHGNRTKNWKTSDGSANMETERAGRTLRNRSRHLSMNNPYAHKAIQSIYTNTIGTGIRPNINAKGKNDAKRLKEIWKLWAETTRCDFDEMNNFYGLQALIKRTVAEAGECLVRVRRIDTGVIPIQFQVVEADLLDSSRTGYHLLGVENPEGKIIQGVEFDKKGKRVAYWLFDEHPGENLNFGSSFESKRIPADEIFHIYHVWRPGQVRGVPYGAASLLKLRDFDDYEGAQLIRQKIAACFTLFVEDSAENLSQGIAGTSKNSKGQLIEKVEPGIIEHLEPGKKITFATPPTTEGYGEYTKTTLRGVTAGYGTTYENTTGDYSNVNFSSGRMGWLEFHRLVTDWQNNVMIPLFCDKAFKWFIKGCNIAGVVSKEDYTASWTAPRREMIDPGKEIKAMSEEVRNGFTSWSEAVRAQGWNPEDLFKEIVEDAARWAESKLMPVSDPRYDPTRAPEGGADAGKEEKKQETKTK
jgi:lambda family phage portal protein